MAKKGHKVFLVNPTPILKKKVKPTNGVQLVLTPSVKDPFYKGKPSTPFPFAFLPISKTLREHKIDVVHVQEPGSIGLSALILAKLSKLPVVGALHFTPQQVAREMPGKPEVLVVPLVRFFIKIVYNRYNAIMVPTKTFAKFLKSVGVKTPIQVVSNGVNTEKFKPSLRNNLLRKKLGFSNKDVVFFFLGRLDRDKNVSTLVKAMPYTTRTVKLLVVGKGRDKEKLHKLAKKLNVESKIIWIDYIKDKEMVPFYNAVDCFSIVSPYEVQSIVTLQAVSSGLPVIAANAGALPELAHNKMNGFLVNTYDYKSLAKKMNRLAKDKGLREKFGKESRKISLAHDKAKNLKKLENLYKSILRT
jgi:glycosyltransferase involved in cell wall biosynthesis